MKKSRLSPSKLREITWCRGERRGGRDNYQPHYSLYTTSDLKLNVPSQITLPLREENTLKLNTRQQKKFTFSIRHVPNKDKASSYGVVWLPYCVRVDDRHDHPGRESNHLRQLPTSHKH
jgi:hypothetical protein